MSLITCPECGEQVSSSTNKCVHCGCTYTACPECGKVHVGELMVCPECGFNITQTKAKVGTDKNRTEANSDIITNIAEAWQSRSYKDQIVMKITRIVSLILIIIIFILAIVTFIVIRTWDNSTLENILKINDVAEKAHGLIIALCIFGVIVCVVGEFEEVYMHIMCGEWIRKNQIDVIPYLKKLKSEVEMSELPTFWNFENFSSAAYLSAVPHDRSVRVTKSVLLVMFAVLIAVTVGICLTQNVDEFLRYKLYGDEFNFKYVSLIFAVVFIVSYHIAKFAMNGIFNKRKEVWLKSL